MERAALQSQYERFLRAMTRFMAQTWQSATNFNQDLAWDTTAVTAMGSMFDVRAAAARNRVHP